MTDDNITPNKGGAPTLAKQVDKRHLEAFNKQQRRMATATKKAGDILNWQLDDLHKCMNPKNKGLLEEDIITNPKFNEDLPISPDNPQFLSVQVPIYEPTRYKENTITAVVKAYLDNNIKYVKQLQDLDKAMTSADKAAKKAMGDPDNTWRSGDYLTLGDGSDPAAVN